MIRAPSPTPHLFTEWGRISRRILGHERLAVFLDFDGTLVRVAPTPGEVRLDEDTRDTLKRLAGHRNVTLAIISGRRRRELQSRVGLRNLKYMGLYGWETNGNANLPFEVREALVCAIMDLMARLPENSGVWIEPKGSSFSVHLLGASPETRREVQRQVETLVKPMRRTLKVMTNLRDLEVAPIAIGDKGVAVRKFLNDPAGRGALPIYFGDDFSDEPGFVAARKGISVLVGKRRTTQANFCLRGPAEVTQALSKIEEVIRWKKHKPRLNSSPSPI